MFYNITYIAQVKIEIDNYKLIVLISFMAYSYPTNVAPLTKKALTDIIEKPKNM